ncbi:MAG: Spx/MgsR family RNA polymerase-binding regulatory protein [Chlorobi bacterium]|nr:Spx/MgsR family RNA polymerase-binding regulatory protein [Chlorobiota bacterium]
MATKPVVKVWGLKTCGTTRKALKFLDSRNIPYQFIDVRESPPPKTHVKKAATRISEPKKLLNTSGGAYREGGWKDKAPKMTKAEIIQAVTTEPMLMKRPLVVSAKGATIGFDQDALDSIL